MEKEIQIKISQLSKSYTEGLKIRTVLNDLSLSVYEGEIIVLIGKSGSGKSTFLNLLAGMDLPDKGLVNYGSVSINEMKEKERTLFRRKHIGFVFQFFNLIPTLTVYENLQLPLELNDQPHEIANEKIMDLLDRVGLADRADSFPDRLSGGEQQRIAVARALIHDPELIIADEPTGNLDVNTGTQILDLLKSLISNEGKTLIMATHSTDAVSIGDRVLSLREGVLHPVNKEMAH